MVVIFAGDVGHFVALRGDARLSTATVETFLDAGMFKPIQLSLEVVEIAVISILNIFDQLR